MLSKTGGLFFPLLSTGIPRHCTHRAHPYVSRSSYGTRVLCAHRQKSLITLFVVRSKLTEISSQGLFIVIVSLFYFHTSVASRHSNRGQWKPINPDTHIGKCSREARLFSIVFHLCSNYSVPTMLLIPV